MKAHPIYRYNLFYVWTKSTCSVLPQTPAVPLIFWTAQRLHQSKANYYIRLLFWPVLPLSHTKCLKKASSHSWSTDWISDHGRPFAVFTTGTKLWLVLVFSLQESERLHPAGDTDLTIPTSKEEQQEYLCWKKEREQIDRERLARHKNAKGQWRRAWDMDKTENM